MRVIHIERFKYDCTIDTMYQNDSHEIYGARSDPESNAID